MMALRSRLSGPRILLLLTAALVLAIGYSRVVRRITLGNEFRYIPKENTLLIATGDLASLLRGAEYHLEDLLAEASPLRPMLAELLGLATEDLGIPTPEKLREAGLDVDRGVLYSVYRTKREGRDKYVVVIPVDDREKLIAAFSERIGEPLKSASGQAWTLDGGTVLQAEDQGLLLAFPEPGLAVLSDSPDLLRRSLLPGDDNLRHASNNDSFYKASHRVLRGPLLAGPNIFLFWQSRAAPFGELAAALRLLPDSIRVEADVDLAGGDLRLVQEALEPAPPDVGWKRDLPPETIVALTVQDRNLSHFLDLALNWGSLTPVLQGLPTDPLRADGGLERAVVAIAPWQGLLPDVMVGLWGEEQSLGDSVVELQSLLRARRDRSILEEALLGGPEEDGPIPAALLEDQGLLEHEPDSLLLRYEIVDGEIVAPTFEASDFESAHYVEPYRGRDIRYLAPMLTENDFNAVDKLMDSVVSDGASKREYLLSNKDRPASVAIDNSLWIASDAQMLKDLVDRREDGGPALADNPNLRRLDLGAAQGEKLRLFIDLDRLASQILLGDLPLDLQDEQSRSVTDLVTGHSAANLSISRRPFSSKIQLSFDLLRRRWESGP